MRRFACIMMAIVMSLSFISCGTVQQDSDSAGRVTISVLAEVDETYAKKYINVFENIYPDVNVDLLTLSKDQTEQEIEIQRIKSEIMAGKGPDVFMLQMEPVHYSSKPEPEKRMFGNIEKTMRAGVFLPLDEYIKNSQLINMELLLQPVMNAGIANGDQVVMPMTYTFDVLTCSVSDDVPELSDFNDYLTWDYAASRFRRSYSYISSAFGNIANYDLESLLISESDVVDILNEYNNMVREPSVGFSSVPEELIQNRAGDFELSMIKNDLEDLKIVPVLNSSGGITATITSCMAINGATENPDEAFKFIELYFSEQVQSRKGVYSENADTHSGYLLRDALISEYTIGADLSVGLNSYNSYVEEVFADFVEETSGMVNAVRFESDIEDMLDDMWLQVLTEKGNSDVERIADDYMMTMRMILSE